MQGVGSQPAPAGLNALIDQWLAHQWLRFPVPLEQQFEADTGHDRARSMCASAAVAICCVWHA
jgi:hypothetical protein